jgi:4-amino-4-deoxy-L-arabinose transferase-like glycosyltransferase
VVLFAFQIYPLYYSKEGRPYIWMVFFALLTAYAFYRLATHARGAWWAVLFGAALAGGCYSHYMAAWLGPVILTWIIGFGYWISREQYAYQRQFLWRSCGGLLLAAVLFLPWIPAFFRVFDYGTHGLYLIHREGLARILGPNRSFSCACSANGRSGRNPSGWRCGVAAAAVGRLAHGAVRDEAGAFSPAGLAGGALGDHHLAARSSMLHHR